MHQSEKEDPSKEKARLRIDVQADIYQSIVSKKARYRSKAKN
jgi:hypothetical protein